MSKLSFSFHISSKNNAIRTSAKLSSTLKHNLRSYSDKAGQENVVLIGSNNARDGYKDFMDAWHNEFEGATIEYNQKQKREDRKIKDYFKHVEGKQDVAVECIIQVGNIDFWNDFSLQEKKKMDEIYKKQIDRLKELVPDFKITSAVIHYDESSPHVQLIGIPVKSECKKGLKKQVGKTALFNKDTLEFIQRELRKNVENEMKALYGENIELKALEKGRNKDLSIQEYKTNAIKKDLIKNINKAKADVQEYQKTLKKYKVKADTVKKIKEISAIKPGILGKISLTQEDFKMLLDTSKVGLSSIEDKQKINTLNKKIDYLTSEINQNQRKNGGKILKLSLDLEQEQTKNNLYSLYSRHVNDGKIEEIINNFMNDNYLKKQLQNISELDFCKSFKEILNKIYPEEKTKKDLHINKNKGLEI